MIVKSVPESNAPDVTTLLATISGIGLPGTGAPQFFGYRDAGGIGRVVFSQDINGYSPSIDNLAFGAVVPLPSAAWMGLGLLGGVGIVARLRKRRSSEFV